MPPKRQNTKIEMTSKGKVVNDKFLIPKGTGGDTIDNQITNSMVDGGKLPASLRVPSVQPTVSADKLATPTTPVTVPQPQVGTIPTNTGKMVNNVTRDVNGFITAQSEEAKQLKELQATYGALGNDGSLSDLFKTTQADYGVTPETLKELKDIQLQLSDMDTESALTKTRIEGAAGQTLGQAQREVTQEDRENAVRSAGKAARAAVLQGNIETATALAKDAVNIAYQDRTLKATNLLNQINMVQGQVDDQTAQLLETEKRGYEAELASIKELKDNIANAMVNGASQSEITQLNDPTIDDATKLTLAQQITARGANQMRNLEISAKNAQIANANRRQTSIVEIDGRPTLVDSQTGDVISTFSESVSVDRAQEFNAKKTAIEEDVNRAEELLGNSLGIQSTAGTYKPGFFGNLLTGAFGVTPENAGGVGNFLKFVPVVGNIIAGNVGQEQKDNFISGVSYIINNQTFDKLTQLKEGGATFGALSDSERVAIGRAASDLAASIETDEQGNITGFKGGEAKLTENLGKVLAGYQAAQDQLNIDYGLEKDEYLEGYNIWNQNQ